MPISITCACGKKIRANDNLAGKKIRCPGCQSIVPVPGPASVASGSCEQAAAVSPPLRRQAGAAAPVRSQEEPEDGPGTRPPSDQPAPRRQVVLRSIVLVLGILGGGLEGFLGFKSYSNVHDPAEIAAFERMRTLLEEAEKAGTQGTRIQGAREEVTRIEQLRRVCYVMLAGGLLGIAGGVLAFLRWGKTAAALMLLPSAAAGALFVASLVTNIPLILAGLLSLLIRWRPRAQPG
jgi:hypothetical protein